MASSPIAPWEDVKYLTDDEVNAFLDDLDHNGDGMIDYHEVQQKLDKVNDEIAPNPLPHHLHQDRHAFLRSIINSDQDRLPRDQFAERVRSWKIPSMKQDQDQDVSQQEYMRKLGMWYVSRKSIVMLGSHEFRGHD